MADRWFSEEELEEMSRPTMDRALEAIEAGDLEQAKALCEAMKHEWRFLHDMMVDGIAASMSWVKEHCGEEAVGESQRWAMERYWKRSVQAIDERSRKEIVRAARRHVAGALDQRHRTPARRLRDRGGRREADLPDEPVRLGAAALAHGPLPGPGRPRCDGGGARLGLQRKGFPIYCTHCTFMNEMLPIQWIGYPVYPSDPPGDFDRDPCTWYWYKDPADIPDRHWERYGLERG